MQFNGQIVRSRIMQLFDGGDFFKWTAGSYCVNASTV